MGEEGAQLKWDEYYGEIKDRRHREAEMLWQLMLDAGVDNDTSLALDFVHFRSSHQGADAGGSA